MRTIGGDCWHFLTLLLSLCVPSNGTRNDHVVILTITNESASARIYRCSISPRSIPRVSNPWKAMADNKTDTIAMNINHEIGEETTVSNTGVRIKIMIWVVWHTLIHLKEHYGIGRTYIRVSSRF